MNLESYPPLFRKLLENQTYEVDPFEDAIKPVQDLDPVPVIDFQCLDQLEEKKKLGEACKDWGLFRLVNHEIPSIFFSQLQEEVKKLFSLEFETKQDAFNDSPLTYFWGTPALTSSGAALTRGTQNINWVEGLNIPMCQLSQCQPQQHPVLESFRFVLVEYGNRLSRIATTLFKAMTRNLNLNLHRVKSKSYISLPTGTIRVYRYPQCSNANINATLGMEVHTDSSVLSILSQDQAISGLEVLKDDEWLTVAPIPNTLIVNMGDMMQAMSDDEYKSVKHRVKLNKHNERISIGYFVFPYDDIVIESSKYKPFTYNDFRAQVEEDIKTFGYKIGLERFHLT
ncbi:Gibberellin 2-beta-dioxygenase 8 [Quillaja saponaria]|uniref:Gibberellin 2-beta-dioxygenase 8 n=1 Tax=Quillaja saponaria TaxID=32244 RepID=A0AAD7LTU5_QUISA|nr:Gibberellin 2-beta-dioxygenase 8 [Quillaja saponaria]